MDEFSIILGALTKNSDIGDIAVFVLIAYALYKRWVIPKETHEKEMELVKNIAIESSKVSGEAMGEAMLADIGEMAEDIKADNKRHQEETDRTIARAVESGVTKGIASVYPLMEAVQTKTNDRLGQIEVEIAMLRQHKKDTEDRL